MTDSIKHFEQQTSLTLCSWILFIQKSSSIFQTEQSCDRLKSDTSAAQNKKTKTKNKNKHTHTHTHTHKNAFRLGLPICHKF